MLAQLALASPPGPSPSLGRVEGLERFALISCLYGSAQNLSGATNQIAVLGM